MKGVNRYIHGISPVYTPVYCLNTNNHTLDVEMATRGGAEESIVTLRESCNETLTESVPGATNRGGIKYISRQRVAVAMP